MAQEHSERMRQREDAVRGNQVSGELFMLLNLFRPGLHCFRSKANTSMYIIYSQCSDTILQVKSLLWDDVYIIDYDINHS